MPPHYALSVLDKDGVTVYKLRADRRQILFCDRWYRSICARLDITAGLSERDSAMKCTLHAACVVTLPPAPILKATLVILILGWHPATTWALIT